MYLGSCTQNVQERFVVEYYRYITLCAFTQKTEEFVLGESIVKPVGEVICIRKFPNFSDDTLTNQHVGL